MRYDLAALLSDKFKSVIDEYRLKVVRVNDVEALLVGSNYALKFGADRDGVDVSYIERESRSRLASYTLRPLTMQRFTAEDSAHYGSPSTANEALLASVSFYASGLSIRCRDVLSGDKSWLRRNSWREEGPSQTVEQLLQAELS